MHLAGKKLAKRAFSCSSDACVPPGACNPPSMHAKCVCLERVCACSLSSCALQPQRLGEQLMPTCVHDMKTANSVHQCQHAMPNP
eukprot:1153010-Pelagomonas_calceolata.AAC.6